LIKTVQTSGSPTIMSVGGAHTIANPAVSFSFSTTYWTIGGANDLTFTGSINLSGSYTHNVSNTGLTTYAGVLHTGGFTKSGSGTLVLSGSNIYTGTTTITSGVLRVANSSALGSPQAPTVVTSGAALEMTGNSLSNEPLAFGGTGVGGSGAIRNLAGTNGLGDATLSNSATIAVDAGRLTLGNVVTAPVAGFVLTKNGPGTLEARRYRPGGFVVSGAVATTSAGRSTDKTSTVGLGNLMISPGATLDIGENDWVVDYVMGGSSPFATLAAQVAQGYNGSGDWQGTGITSRFAAATASSAHKTAVGIAEASDIFSGFPASFSGQNVDSSAVLIRYTYSGDANLDGSVDTVDFNLLASNFSNTGARWSQGDFNYDGMVDTMDFGLLASNFSLTLGGSTTNLGALVPEPSVPLSVVCIMGLAARKRQRHPRN
jgi:autotransporter-associated beta strand protein